MLNRILATTKARALLIGALTSTGALGLVARMNYLPPPPTMDLASVMPDSGVLDRSLCVTVGMGAMAAAECGDLRFVHPLPSVRTLNQLRTPVLIYNSAHAQPFPIVRANVSLSKTNLTRVITSLYVEGRLRGLTVVPAGAWPDTINRVAVGYDAARDSTGFYRYELRVKSVYTTGADSASKLGTLVVVNRKNSYFAPGWWLAGFERLYMDARGNPAFWVGGDGSTRRYFVSTTGSKWVAAKVDRPDTIVLVGRRFVRLLPGGDSVIFDLSGRHVATANRLGQRTVFRHRFSRLDSIYLPVPTSALARAHAFLYTTGQVRIESPGPSTTNRVTTISKLTDQVTISDPDTTTVRFDYASGSGRIVARYDKLNHATTYKYGTAGKAIYSKLTLENGDSIVMKLRAGEAVGFPDSVDGVVRVDSAYTRIDGPRTDVSDITRMWIDRVGAPTRSVNALGHATVVQRTDSSFPALVTQITHPSGWVQQAKYDPRGNPDTLTSVNPFGNGNAVTVYTWNPLDAMTRIQLPEGEVSSVGYDGRGNRIWEKPSSNTAKNDTVRYAYADSAQGTRLASITLPNGAVEQFFYDTRANLNKTKTPLGFYTMFYSDAAGRDTLVVSPIDTTLARDTTRWKDTLKVRTRTHYDVMDRADTVTIIGPARPNCGDCPPAAKESLVVATTYDDEGRPTDIYRGGNGSSMEYDWRGRKITEYNGQGTTVFVYDPAGNVIRTIDANGAEITTAYDALNRPVVHITPSKTYAKTTCHPSQPIEDPCIGSILTFPLYPNAPDSALRTPGDTATFAYDPLGSMTKAWNRSARIHRAYYTNGSLQKDSMAIRNYSPLQHDSVIDDSTTITTFPEPTTDSALDLLFTTHVYKLTIEYDLNGRRKKLNYPAVSSFLGFGDGVVDYGYDAEGRIDTIAGMVGTYTYLYDILGRDSVLAFPGGGRDSTAYDADGRLVRRWQHTSLFSARNDTLIYDARNKVIALNPTDLEPTLHHYSGLGTLIGAEVGRDNKANETTYIEGFVVDPLGSNLQKKRPNFPFIMQYSYTGDLVDSIAPVRDPTAPTPSGELVDRLYYEFDNAGHLLFATNRRRIMESTEETSTDGPRTSTRHFYDGSGKLFVTQTYDEVGGNPRGIFQEQWYDALGRRVLVRVRRGPTAFCNGAKCNRYIDRFIWDGDQILAELRVGLTSAQDSLWRGSGFDPQGGTGYAYTHGKLLDKPLEIVTFGTRNTLIPLMNWRGLFDSGTDTLGVRNTTSIDWAATYRGSYGDIDPDHVKGWAGSLASDQRDATGLQYRRNRYYDPMANRFTQEDPIGLAGGLNLYSYASGDPVSYRDPFGLCPWPPSSCFGRQGADLAASFTPGVSTSVDVATALSGTNPVTGEDVGLLGRGFAAAGVLSPLAGGQFRAGARIGDDAVEGIYEFVATTGRRYVGQSVDVARRIGQHISEGRAAEGVQVMWRRVVGGRTAREIPEQTRIDELGGVDDLENYRNAIGSARRHLMGRGN